VGHYAGCVRMWRALQQQQPGSIPGKVERSIAAMEECLLQYPLYQPQVSCRAHRGCSSSSSSSLSIRCIAAGAKAEAVAGHDALVRASGISIT
jgi:hypothetical protein